jgi:hypothetical protein
VTGDIIVSVLMAIMVVVTFIAICVGNDKR